MASLLLALLVVLLPDVAAQSTTASTRVAGIGVGLFLVIFFGVLALCCCVVGSNSSKPA